MKKKLCLFLATIICVTCMAGCGKDKQTVTKVAEGEIPEKLSIFCTFGGYASKAGAKDNNDLLAFKIMEERTGCHVEWTHPASGTADEKFNLMIASGNLPDMIVYDWQNVTGGAKMYADDELIYPLGKLIEENMPNLSKYNAENPDTKKQYTDDGGEIYYIPFIRKDKQLNVFLGPQIRRDWLDKLGLEIPETTEELYNVLKAFKTQDPNGNGKADEIPMTGVGFEATAYGVGNLCWPFGTHYDFYVSNGKVTHGAMEDRFTEALEYISKLYKEGLIDIDFLLNDRSKMDSKMMNNTSGFVYSYQPTLYYNNMNDGTRKVEGIPHLTGPYGDHPSYVSDYGNSVTGRAVAVTTANKNPSGSLKWLDEFYGEDGIEIMNFGKEGETFTWVDDYPKITDYVLNNPDGKDRMSMCALNLGTYESVFPTLQDWRYYEQTLSEWGRNAIVVWEESAQTDGILPPLTFTAEEADEVSQVMSQIKTYFSENITKIVVGKQSVDTMKDIREKMIKMGFNDILKIYNDAYKRYCAR